MSSETFDRCLLTSNYAAVKDRVAAAIAKRGGGDEPAVRLVAVSKTKPAEAIQHLHESVGVVTFGENYVQELIEKSRSLSPAIQWHFIGHLQSNKAASLVEEVKSLEVVETVDSAKLAKKLNAAVEAFRPSRPLSVFIQVNTSGEDTKCGVEPGADTVALATAIVKECGLLRLKGLMTIGKPDYTSTPEDFVRLKQCRDDVAAVIGVEPSSLELSMGMSGDFEEAIIMGSTNVRVGSSIFGARDYSSKK